MEKNGNKDIGINEEEEIEVLTLEDSDGGEITFEVVATTEYKNKQYIVLLPLEEYGDADEYTILEIKEGDNENEPEFVGISDMNILTAVYKKFCAESESDV